LGESGLAHRINALCSLFFDDAEMLLAATEKFEDIVSKKRENVGWVKVKTAAGREPNPDRWDMFERGR